jgi:outer membrane protein assembly factor BamB
MADSNPQGWWMYQGGAAHDGFVTDTPINASNAANLTTAFTLQVGGPILSVPAVTDGYVYVGVANATAAPGNNGGGLLKVNLLTGVTEHSFIWPVDLTQRDTHGFTGMGCTPAVSGGNVYFSAFDGWFYCLSQADLSLVWKTNLRGADLGQNQPVTNDSPPLPVIPAPSWITVPNEDNRPTWAPPAAGWSSPVVANGKVYVGMGEGENPELFGFVYCMDAATGKVIWIFCTGQLAEGVTNQPNQVPASTIMPGQTLPPGFTAVEETGGFTQVRGASVWSGIAYADGLLYVTTGNPAAGDNGLPVNPSAPPDPHATPGCTVPDFGSSAEQLYTYSVLTLDAETGALQKIFTPTQDTSYRPSDLDIDFGGSAAVFTQGSRQVVAVANKNGTLFLLDASDLSVINARQLLPYDSVTGQRIPSVDPHPSSSNNSVSPSVPDNCTSDSSQGENFSGAFGAPAVDTANGIIFVGLGGPNYHSSGPGIDYQSTPFMRAVKWDTLDDAWPMEPYTFTPGNNLSPVTVMRYTAAGAGAAMYQNPAEGCIGSPAVANDVVFVGTQTADSAISLYAFNAVSGQLLWSDALGMPTQGLNGGYGYCMGAAIWQNFVVAGALVQGRDGGVLRIYTLGGGGGGGNGGGYSATQEAGGAGGAA